MRPLILVTNDDGATAPGLVALAEAVADLGECWIVAPESEQSAMSHALTLHKPLRCFDLGTRHHAVSGTPTDCVAFAVRHLLPRRPNLVVSGINRGANLADDVTYSGTVSAALEAALLGLPGVAFSLLQPGPLDWRAAQAVARRVAEQVLAHGLPPDVYLNVNVPAGPPEALRGLRTATLGHRLYEGPVVEKHDPRGRPYYWMGGAGGFQFRDIEGSDCNAVSEGWASVTPLLADPTWNPGLALLRGWGLDDTSPA